MKYCDKCRSSYPNEFNVCPIDNSALLVTSELIAGMIIRDKYLILDKVGEGGMGMVFRTRHLAFNEIRALKVVHQSYAEDKGFIKRFKTEAVIARKLQHPNAVRIDDLDSTEDGRPFIVMEMVEGSNLKAVIAETGQLSASRVVSIASQVADALAAAHELGIVHRDIKPDNILITPSIQNSGDLVKVVDFGIAKVLEGTIDVGPGYTATRTGIVVGTPQYLSPEQAAGMHGDQIDGRADIYSLGIVIYVMLTGRLPFNSDTPMGFLMHHLRTTPAAPHVIRPDLSIPRELSAILMKAMEKDPKDRFSSAGEMVQALRRVQGHSRASPRYSPQVVRTPENAAGDLQVRSSEAASPVPRHETPVVPFPGPARTLLPRKPLLAGLAAASIVAIGAVLAVIHFSRATTGGQNIPSTAVTTIDASTKNVAQDASIRTTIEHGILDLKGSSIQVTVQSGVVTLLGHSPAKDDAEHAETLASQVTGVKVVRNEIQVEPDHPTPFSSSTNAVDQTAEAKAKKPSVAVAEQPKRINRGAVDNLISAGKQATENGEYDSAISNFQKALQADPRNAVAQAGLSRAQQAKQTEEQVLSHK